MKIREVRPASQSRTMQSLNRSDTIQHLTIAMGAVLFGVWVVLPDSLQGQIRERAIPVASAMMAGAGFAAKWYNSKAKDGRIDVGDLFTSLDALGPNQGQFAKAILMTAEEYATYQQAMQHNQASSTGSIEATVSQSLPQSPPVKKPSVNGAVFPSDNIPASSESSASLYAPDHLSLEQGPVGSSSADSAYQVPALRNGKVKPETVSGRSRYLNGHSNQTESGSTAVLSPSDLTSEPTSHPSPEVGTEITEDFVELNQDDQLWDDWT